jgi:phosphatidate cytidylyltransferase
MNNFTKRLIFGSIYVLLVVFATLYNKHTFYLLFYVFMMFCIYEFQKLIDYKSYIPYLFGSLLYLSFESTNIFSFLSNNIENNTLLNTKYFQIIFVISTLIIFSTFIYTLFKPKLKANEYLGKTFLTILYIIVPFALLFHLPNSSINYDNKIILGIFILIWTNDTFAYLVGKNFGKHKLFERISPKKTIEGFIGGFLFSLIASYILSIYFTKQSFYIWIIIAVIVSIFGTIGDLIESKFKRDANIKDSSQLIPGHGGFLDRLDSVIFAIPFIYSFFYINNNLISF